MGGLQGFSFLSLCLLLAITWGLWLPQKGWPGTLKAWRLVNMSNKVALHGAREWHFCAIDNAGSFEWLQNKNTFWLISGESYHELCQSSLIFWGWQQTQRVEPAKLLNHETHTGKWQREESMVLIYGLLLQMGTFWTTLASSILPSNHPQTISFPGIWSGESTYLRIQSAALVFMTQGHALKTFVEKLILEKWFHISSG